MRTMLWGWRYFILMWGGGVDEESSKMRRADRRRCLDGWAEEMKEARVKSDWHSLWVLARKNSRVRAGTEEEDLRGRGRDEGDSNRHREVS